jgi:excisionase family DNA binding protein
MEPLALKISDDVKLGGPCRSVLYQDIRNGRLRAVKRGRSTRILLDDFKEYLASMSPIAPKTSPGTFDDQPKEHGGRRRRRS